MRNFMEERKINITNNELYVSDPIYLDEENLHVCVDNVHNGAWIINYVGGNLRARHCNFELDEDEFIFWDDAIGLIGVDSGTAGFCTCSDADIFDENCKDFDFRWTPRGDGLFPLLAKYDDDGAVIALEIVYDGGYLFNYTHGIVNEDDERAAIEAVETNDWEAYNELAERYNKLSGDYPCFPDLIFIGMGGLPLNEETFGLVDPDNVEFENG